MSNVKIIGTRQLYKGFVEVKEYQLQHTLFAGGWSPVFTREIVIRSSAAAVLPYDPILDKVILIEQFRAGALNDTSPWLIEIIAGLLNSGENPEQLAHREAQEEAGITIQEIVKICEYWASPGATNEYLTLFCGQVDASHAGGIYGLAEENEDIRVHVVDSTTAFTMLEKGQIKNSICIIALLWLQLNKEKLKNQWSK